MHRVEEVDRELGLEVGTALGRVALGPPPPAAEATRLTTAATTAAVEQAAEQVTEVDGVVELEPARSRG